MCGCCACPPPCASSSSLQPQYPCTVHVRLQLSAVGWFCLACPSSALLPGVSGLVAGVLMQFSLWQGMVLSWVPILPKEQYPAFPGLLLEHSCSGSRGDMAHVRLHTAGLTGTFLCCSSSAWAPGFPLCEFCPGWALRRAQRRRALASLPHLGTACSVAWPVPGHSSATLSSLVMPQHPSPGDWVGFAVDRQVRSLLLLLQAGVATTEEGEGKSLLPKVRPLLSPPQSHLLGILVPARCSIPPLSKGVRSLASIFGEDLGSVSGNSLPESDEVLSLTSARTGNWLGHRSLCQKRLGTGEVAVSLEWERSECSK